MAAPKGGPDAVGMPDPIHQFDVHRIVPIELFGWDVSFTNSSAYMVLVVLLSVGMIFGTLYLSFSPVGFYIIDGVQGRYFLPLAFVGFAVLLRWIPLRVTGADGRVAARGPAIAITLLTVGSLTAAILKYSYVVWG